MSGSNHSSQLAKQRALLEDFTEKIESDEELSRADQEAFLFTEWSAELMEDVWEVWWSALLKFPDSDGYEELEVFARKYGWPEQAQTAMVEAYEDCFAVAPVPGFSGSDLEYANKERDKALREQLPAATSALLIEVWWQTIQQNEPHRLTKDVLAAFVSNENTPEAIRDEARIELEFHYGEATP